MARCCPDPLVPPHSRLAQNQFDSIDLSDNEIRKVECMAVLPRLKMLLLCNNRVSRIADRLGAAFPNLETLVLTNNALSALKELEPLAALPTITSLSLVDNPVSLRLNGADDGLLFTRSRLRGHHKPPPEPTFLHSTCLGNA